MIMVQQQQQQQQQQQETRGEFSLETDNVMDSDKPGELPQLVKLSPGRSPVAGNPFRHSKRTGQLADRGILCEHDKIVNMLNPEPLPYQVQRFKPCTSLKIVDVPRRHVDSFGQNLNDPIQKAKAIIVHTDRFTWDAKPADHLTQRDRLITEQEQVEIARVLKRRGDVLAHRERHELLLGGEKVSMQDRDLSSKEINAVLTEHLEFGLGGLMPPQPSQLSAPIGADLRPPEVHVVRKPENGQVPESADSGLWEPERQTFENQVNTVSMGVQRAVLHLREKTGETTVSPPSPPKRQSQVPRLPRLPVSQTENETALLPRPPPPLKRRGLSEMVMGGARVPLNERADIQSELRRLKSVPLPQTARELFIGRGIRLPPNHATIKPRRPPPTAEPIQVSSFPQADTPPSHGVHITTSCGAKVHISSSPNAEAPAVTNMNDAEAQEQENLGELPEEDQAALDIGPPQPEPQPEQQPEPRPQSTPTQRPTPNPLKMEGIYERGALFKSVHPELSKDELQQTFKRLDTDLDGHITFPQMEKEIPATFTAAERRYVKEIYNIVSASTFFGSEEFALIKLFCRKVEDMSKESRENFEKIKDLDLHDGLVKFVEMFQSVDRANSGEITVDSLKEILATMLEKDLTKDADYLTQVVTQTGMQSENNVDKLDFLCHIPYFLGLEPSLQSQFASQRAKTILEG